MVSDNIEFNRHVSQHYVGFTISLYEYEATIPTLWKAVRGSWFKGLPMMYTHLCW